MDYTNNPGSNKNPDESNFIFLAQLYGGRNSTDGTSITSDSVVAMTTTTTSTTEDVAPPVVDDKDDEEAPTGGKNGNGNGGGPGGKGRGEDRNRVLVSQIIIDDNDHSNNNQRVLLLMANDQRELHMEIVDKERAILRLYLLANEWIQIWLYYPIPS